MFPEDVEELPFNIDRTCVFCLNFQKDQRMKSTKHSRPWNAWVTTNSKACPGVRRKTTCSGSFKCRNSKCMFRQYFAKSNQLPFTKSETSCDVCGSFGEFTPCTAEKIWEFNDLDSTVLVYHTGKHTCEARKPSKWFNIFKNKKHKTATQVSEDAIINCLKDEELDWDNILKVTDSTLEREKLYHSKRKAKEQEQPHGHSLEGVASLRAKLNERDPFYIYKLKDRNMDDKPTFVFKTNRSQAQIALAMNQVSNLFLNGMYCFDDGTFKRCLDFVTLETYTYVCLLRKMVKFCSMEFQSESAENWVIE